MSSSIHNYNSSSQLNIRHSLDVPREIDTPESLGLSSSVSAAGEEEPLAPPPAPIPTTTGSIDTGSSFQVPTGTALPAIENEKPRLYPLRFGPWWQFCSAADRDLPKSRILPSVAAILMPITVLFVLTSVEGNWVQAGPGFDGLRITKGTGYVVGNAIATALAFGSALTIATRQSNACRRYFTLKIAMFAQVFINLLLGAVCVLVGAVYQRNVINARRVWITPEYSCIYVGAALAFLQATLLLTDYVTTPNFNQRGHGYGNGPMQAAIGLANVVAIWTGFGSLIFSSVENKTFWHAYNSCFNSWVTLITTGATVLNYQTVSSKVFIFFWLPTGVLIMFVYVCCFGIGCIERFDEKPLRRIGETEEQLRSSYRELRRIGPANKELSLMIQERIRRLYSHLAHLQHQRLVYFSTLFVTGVILKICTWLLGSIIFVITEPGWSYWDSMVFLFFNLLTVGVQGMVPRSATGMPLYHGFTFLEILFAAALDLILFHILWNLVPWPHYQHRASVILASVSGKVFSRRGRMINSSSSRVETEPTLAAGAAAEPLPPPPPQPEREATVGGLEYEKFSREQATDSLEGAANIANRLRELLAQTDASKDDLQEYDHLLRALEGSIDNIRMKGGNRRHLSSSPAAEA